MCVEWRSMALLYVYSIYPSEEHIFFLISFCECSRITKKRENSTKLNIYLFFTRVFYGEFDVERVFMTTQFNRGIGDSQQSKRFYAILEQTNKMKQKQIEQRTQERKRRQTI